MQTARKKVRSTRHWAARARPVFRSQTPQQARRSLASIVEKETAIPDERRHIAAVFINRLRLGMKLQSDPTIIYGITRGYPLGRGIRESEIQALTPYNTYVIGGLPPTPICNPGKDSIAAVLDPDRADDLYFVADGTGGHVFAADIAEHQRNVARWRKIEEQLKDYGPVITTERKQEPKATAKQPGGSWIRCAPSGMTIRFGRVKVRRHLREMPDGRRQHDRFRRCARRAMKAALALGGQERQRPRPRLRLGCRRGLKASSRAARMLAGERFRRGNIQATLTLEPQRTSRALKIDRGSTGGGRADRQGDRRGNRSARRRASTGFWRSRAYRPGRSSRPSKRPRAQRAMRPSSKASPRRSTRYARAPPKVRSSRTCAAI